MRRNLFTTISILLAGFLTQSAHLSWAQRPTYPEPPPYEERGYEDFYTFKYGKSFIRDPWVWGYTKEFAKRFRMPEKWIEPELKGVLAIAFRMNQVGNATCGLGGKEDNCWPRLECQMDIYYDSKIQLPWNRPDIMRDSFIGGISSGDFLHQENKYIKYRDPKHPDSYRGTGVGFGISINDKNTRAFSKVTYYDRALFPGIGIVGVQGDSVCPYEVGPASASLGGDSIIVGKAAEETFKKAYKHRVNLPATFITRAHKVYEQKNKINTEITNRLIQEFQEQHK